MTLRIADVAPAVIATEYAVRGPIVARAAELEKQGRQIIYCNIGNPQALGQHPLTWHRQILALCQYPDLMTSTPEAFPEDVKEAARAILAGTQHGLGAYSESRGVRAIREAVAEYILERDHIGVDPDAIFLTDGASKAVQTALRLLIATPEDGIMVPIPQYPLYSASIAMYRGRLVPYCLDEADAWRLSRAMLDNAYAEAQAQGTKVKAICVINPGNPTGAVLDEANIRMVLAFAEAHGLTVLADEVYQENIYQNGAAFTSFARVHHEMGLKEVTLFSFHSCSKGLLGECGVRGGYLEYRNLPDDVAAQILKLQSIALCANLTGQAAVYAMVKTPKPGMPSYPRYRTERAEILDSLKTRAALLVEGLNRIEGITCNPIAGAMYAFPSITLPPGRTDSEYALALLEQTGICVVPGTGFGQVEGTAHFRTTILPPKDQIETMVEALAAFHRSFR